MIEKIISNRWQTIREEMDFEISYKDLLKVVEDDLDYLGKEKSLLDSFRGMIKSNKGEEILKFFEEERQDMVEKMISLYIRIPAIISTILDYKVDVEQTNPDSGVMQRTWLMESLEMGKTVYSLDSSSVRKLSDLANKTSRPLGDKKYVSRFDEYTWKAAYPAKIIEFVNKINDKFEELKTFYNIFSKKSENPFIKEPDQKAFDLILALGHGGIRSGLLVSNLMGIDLYVVRFTKFGKREESRYTDEVPQLSHLDKVRLGGNISNMLILDDIIKGGKTMQRAYGALTSKSDNPLESSDALLNSGQTYTGAVISMPSNEIIFKPDFVGRYVNGG